MVLSAWVGGERTVDVNEMKRKRVLKRCGWEEKGRIRGEGLFSERQIVMFQGKLNQDSDRDNKSSSL